MGNTSKNSMRDITLDIAKGIGIILVVIGHCINYKSIPGIFVYAFHMPLFFFISGVCFNTARHQEFVPFLYKRVRQLLVPAIVFTMAEIALEQLLMPGAAKPWSHLLWQGFTSAKWFLGVLFVTELAYWGIHKAVRGKRSLLIVSTLVALALALITSAHGLCNPYQIFATFAALFFYGTGHLLRPFVLQGSQCFGMKAVMLGACALFAVECASTVITHHCIGMSGNVIVPSDLIASFTGLFAVLCFSRAMSKFRGGYWRDALIWLGRNSLVLMAVHMFFISLCCYYLQPLLPRLPYKLTEQVFVWLFSLTTAWLVNRYAKWTIGK